MNPGRSVVLAIALCFAAQATASTDQSFDSDGCKIAYTDDGSGAPVILLHGFAANYALYRGMIGDGLGKDFRIIGIDQRGHGASDKPHDEDAYGKHFATDVLNLMDHLHLASAQVVGHSMGGIVAIYLAANHPERFRSAVTIGNGLFSRGELTLIGWLMRGQFLWTHVKRLFGAADDPTSDLLGKGDEDALIPAVQSLGDLVVSEPQAAAMKVPVLAARGGPKDDPRDTVERLNSVNPSVETIRIESEDHLSMLRNATFRQALKAFLSRHAAAGT